MGKLSKRKEWLTVKEAARHLSTMFDEEVNEADVLQLGLDEQLQLSVRFVNGTKARRVNVVQYSRADLEAAVAGGGLPENLHHVYLANDPTRKPITDLISRDSASVRLLSDDLDEDITEIYGIWDLPMIDNGRLDIEGRYQYLTGGPATAIPSLDGILVEREGDLTYKLQEEDEPVLTESRTNRNGGFLKSYKRTYQLFNIKLIPDMSKNSTNSISRQLARAREDGIIPWAWIVDETRAAERPSRWQDPGSIVDAAVRGYRRDNWQDQQVRVEVWAEKGTVRGTLAPVLDELGVTLRVMHGFSSATVVNNIADESVNSDVPLIALYVGDYDPSGMAMSERDLPKRLDKYGADVDLRRIGLLREDIAGIPQFDASTKVCDPNHGWFVARYGDRCAELDAMRPPDLRERVREAIVAEMDMDAWDRALEVESVEVASMKEFHQAWLGRLRNEC